MGPDEPDEEAEARARAEKEEKKRRAAQAAKAAALLKKRAEDAKRYVPSLIIKRITEMYTDRRTRTDSHNASPAPDAGAKQTIPANYTLKKGETVAQVVGRTIDLGMDDF